jgi:hypothetical protein
VTLVSPIGISDFRLLRQQGAMYVDKTAAVARVLSGSALVLLFPRPHGFGKTLLLSTLQAFVERGTDEDERLALFGDLAIWQDPAARAHAGRYPVVSMTFQDIAAPDWPACLQGIGRVLAETFLAHRDTVYPGLNDIEARDFDAITARQAGPVQLAGSLQFLTRLLHRHHGERVVLLIDDYDTPIQASYMHGYHDRAFELLGNLLSDGYKDNPHLGLGVLTGVARLGSKSMFSGLNNIDVFSLLRSDHGASFGFTEPEVRALAAAAGAEAHLGLCATGTAVTSSADKPSTTRGRC